MIGIKYISKITAYGIDMNEKMSLQMGKAQKHIGNIIKCISSPYEYAQLILWSHSLTLCCKYSLYMQRYKMSLPFRKARKHSKCLYNYMLWIHTQTCRGFTHVRL